MAALFKRHAHEKACVRFHGEKAQSLFNACNVQCAPIPRTGRRKTHDRKMHNIIPGLLSCIVITRRYTVRSADTDRDLLVSVGEKVVPIFLLCLFECKKKGLSGANDKISEYSIPLTVVFVKWLVLDQIRGVVSSHAHVEREKR